MGESDVGNYSSGIGVVCSHFQCILRNCLRGSLRAAPRLVSDHALAHLGCPRSVFYLLGVPQAQGSQLHCPEVMCPLKASCPRHPRRALVTQLAASARPFYIYALGYFSPRSRQCPPPPPRPSPRSSSSPARSSSSSRHFFLFPVLSRAPCCNAAGTSSSYRNGKFSNPPPDSIPAFYL